MTVSDYVIQFLEKQGVKHIFMLSGGGCIHLVNSLGKSKIIKYVCNLHEQGASICAEAYAQYTNNLGVVLVTTGPGGLNTLTGIAGAWLDSTPLLVICGQVKIQDRGVYHGLRQLGFQEIDNVSVSKNITKYSKTITDPESIGYELEKAVFLSKSGRPGPVLLEIPLDIQSSNINEDTITHFYPDNQKIFTWKHILNRIICAINASKKPIILVGNGVRLSGAYREFLKFIEETKIPVLTTWKAIDFLEEEHPLFVGRPGTIASRGSNFNQQNSDLIICIGARLDHGQIAYQQQYFAPRSTKIIVDIDKRELDKFTFDNYIPVVSDAREFLIELNRNINKININTDWWLKKCKEIYKKYPVILPDHYKNNNNVNLYAFIDQLSDLLPPESLIIPGSSGMCSEVTMQAFKIKKGTRLFNTEGLGSMGFGIPASIGACLAANNKETICIDGDGGFFLNIQELEVAHRLNLPIKFFVLNNQGYGTIRNTQRNYFNGNLVGCDPSSGVTLPDLKKTAYAFNIKYDKISITSGIKKTLKSILGKTYPIICEVMMDENHMTLPRTAVIKHDDGSFEALPMENMKPFLDKKELQSNLL